MKLSHSRKDLLELATLLQIQGDGPLPMSATLMKTLQAYYSLDEANGPRADQGRFGVPLTPGGTTLPGNVAGKVRNANNFLAAQKQNLSRAVFPQAGYDITVACWVNPRIASFVGAGIVFQNFSIDLRFYIGSGGSAHWQAYTATSVLIFDMIMPSGTFVSNVWTFVVLQVDAANTQASWQVNNGPVTKVSFTPPLAAPSGTFMMGSDGANNSYDGLIDEFGFWNSAPGQGGLLTPAQLTYLWNNGLGMTYPFSSPQTSSLANNLTAYYKLEEASGPRADSTTNAVPLTPAGSTLPSNAAGKVGNACSFPVSTPTLAGLSRPTLAFSNLDFTFAAWVNPTIASFTGVGMIFLKGGIGLDNVRLYINANGSYSFNAYQADGSTIIFNVAGPAGAFTTGVWHFICCWVDSVNKIAYCQLDNKTPLSVSFATPLADTGTTFYIGSSGGGNGFVGLIDEFAVWKSAPGAGGMLTAAQRAALYNAGVGETYPLAPVSTLLNNLSCYFKLDEASGVRVDSTGNIAAGLTPNGTPLPANAGGQVASALSLAAANSQYLSVPDQPPLELGGVDFTIGFWINCTLPASSLAFILEKGSPQEWRLFIAPSGAVSFSGPGGSFTVNGPFNLTGGVWHAVMVTLDSVAQVASIMLDGSAPSSASYTSGVVTGAGTFWLGSDGGTANFLTALIDEFAVWKSAPGAGGVLTPAQQAAWYNNGAGVTYPFVGVP
jgi:hypothetical protein